MTPKYFVPAETLPVDAFLAIAGTFSLFSIMNLSHLCAGDAY